jgi:hypothetical protein
MRIVSCLILLACLSIAAAAKNEPPITMSWPPEKPALKLTFDKFRQQGSYAGQNSYQADVVIENLTEKLIPRAFFTVYFFNREKVRIGEGTLLVADLDARQTAKMQFQFNSLGVPSSLTLSAKREMLGAKTIPLRVVSVPAGAALSVDGASAGITPVIVRLTVGTHQLDLVKEGYAPGATSIDVTADELPGGSITVELGGLSRDTVELRDGTIVLGDVLSLTMTDVVVRVDGKDQSYPRNSIKKMMFVERVIEQRPAVVQSPAAQPK